MYISTASRVKVVIPVLRDVEQMFICAAAASVDGVLANYIRWENGRSQNLITLMNDGKGQGFAAWRGLPDPEKWQALVQEGLRSQQICF